MARKPTRIDDDAPPMTDAELAEMPPAAEVLTAEELAAVTSVLRAVRGRPPVANAKVPVTIGLDADTVAAFKATGAGWQTRMNDVLRGGQCPLDRIRPIADPRKVRFQQLDRHSLTTKTSGLLISSAGVPPLDSSGSMSRTGLCPNGFER